MKTHGKKYNEAKKLVEEKAYTLAEALPLLKKTSVVKFDATCEVHFKLGLDPKQADQNLRTTVALAHGTGKEVKIVAFVDEGKVKEAVAAGASVAGTEELMKKIETGWLDFDIAVATPDQMKNLGKIAKTLGQKGLMPNPKSGTVTLDPAKTIQELKKGRIELRLDKDANLHSIFGKISFDENKLKENLISIIRTVLEAKPASAKGTYMQSLFITSSMGPGIKLDIAAAVAESK